MKLIERIKLKLKNTKYYESKKRFIIFLCIILSAYLVGIILFKTVYATYESRAKLTSNIDQALYIFNDTKLDFNIDTLKIIPSNDSYTYKFSVANYTTTKHSDVDLVYNVKVTTTTNLPLTYRLYRNENYNEQGATNILDTNTVRTDTDGSWYNVMIASTNYNFYYNQDNTDIYTLVIDFPKSYASDTTYADNIDSIQIELDSRQVIE